MKLITKFVEIKKTTDLFKILIGYLVIIILALFPGPVISTWRLCNNHLVLFVLKGVGHLFRES